jgi:hypothetical protein
LVCLQLQAYGTNDPSPSPDASVAGVDGPFVFYRNGQVIVKQISQVKEQLIFTSKSYSQNKSIRLSCKSEQTADQFSFEIVNKLEPEPDTYEQPDKMLVISDIEGNFNAFKMMLFGAGVLDKEFNWKFGKGHIVLLGDFMDRGLDVNAVLWLAYKMDHESKLHGGKVHFILGNHEVMNLTGDHRYVRNKYFENALIIKENYKNWYQENSEIGRWLRTKNAVERIGDRLFCHAGISPQIAYSQLTMSDINTQVKASITKLNPKQSERSGMALATAQSTSPLWYRGLARQDVKEHELQAIMGWSKAKQIVIGHTLVNDIQLLYDGRVVAMDLMHETNVLQGFTYALWIENDTPFVINHEGKKRKLLANQAELSKANK